MSRTNGDEVPAETMQAVLKHSSPSFCANRQPVCGYSFTDERTGQPQLNYDAIFDSFETTGIQARELNTAFKVVDAMLLERLKPFEPDLTIEDEFVRPRTGCTIFLAFTTPMATTGIVDNIVHLLKNNLVDCLVTTLSAIEANYGVDLDEHYRKFLESQPTNRQQVVVSPSRLVEWLGHNVDINRDKSIAHWAAKNKIPIFCPSTNTVAIRRVLKSMSSEHLSVYMDKVSDVHRLNGFAHNTSSSKTGVIILGGGVPKHHTMNANLMRNGADFSVYLNTASEFDASDTGAEPDEAVSWGKVRPESKCVKVNCDPTITFPILVARTFQQAMLCPSLYGADGRDQEMAKKASIAQTFAASYVEMFHKFKSAGFQASRLWKATSLVREMIEPAQHKSRCNIFLSYTSNMISSGIREHIKFLVKHSQVACLVTTAGGIEEDLIKCLGNSSRTSNTYVGNFRLQGSTLRENGINRIGNLLVPNTNYTYFEDWIQPIFTEMLAESNTWSVSRMIEKLGLMINNPDSVCYWAAKNKIPVFCPAITDGSIGDMMHLHAYRCPGLVIEDMSDETLIERLWESSRSRGAIYLGGGEARDFIDRIGEFEYKVIIDSTPESSDLVDREHCCRGWKDDKMVQVTCDASIALPLVIANSFYQSIATKHEIKRART